MVLAVDDEKTIADGLRLTLEAEGYDVRTAGSVRTALGALAEVEPHAAIVGLVLPGGRVAENLELRLRLVDQAADSEILGQGAGLQRVLETVASVADTDANVLIVGESGTGKELIANAPRGRGRRAQG